MSDIYDIDNYNKIVSEYIDSKEIVTEYINGVTVNGNNRFPFRSGDLVKIAKVGNLGLYLPYLYVASCDSGVWLEEIAAYNSDGGLKYKLRNKPMRVFIPWERVDCIVSYYQGD